MYPEDLKYTKEHEWLRSEGDTAVIGITHYAQDQLGDVVFVDLPDVGIEYQQGDAFGVVESVKTVSDLYMPISGKVVAVNEELLDAPELVNVDPYGAAWMVKIAVADPKEIESLLSADQYRAEVE